MDEFSYLTVESKTTGQYKEKGSKFLSFALPVVSEIEVKTELSKLKKEYFDARHHCFAWIIGSDRCRYRASDDGEPNHSAGYPILGQIKSKNLTNVLVVVVRYFGGVKLGVGGLITAYRAAAKDALDKAEIVEKEMTQRLIFRYDYSSTPEIMRFVKHFELQVISHEFESECRLETEIKIRFKEDFIKRSEWLTYTDNHIDIKWL